MVKLFVALLGFFFIRHYFVLALSEFCRCSLNCYHCMKSVCHEWFVNNEDVTSPVVLWGRFYFTIITTEVGVYKLYIYYKQSEIHWNLVVSFGMCELGHFDAPLSGCGMFCFSLYRAATLSIDRINKQHLTTLQLCRVRCVAFGYIAWEYKFLFWLFRGTG